MEMVLLFLVNSNNTDLQIVPFIFSFLCLHFYSGEGAKQEKTEMVLNLIRNGASIASRNILGFAPSDFKKTQNVC